MERTIIFEMDQTSQALSLALDQGTVCLFRLISFIALISAVMYQGYTQSKGDCQALGLVVYQLGNFLLHAAHNRMWLIETEDAPTVTPGKGDNQYDDSWPTFWVIQLYKR